MANKRSDGDQQEPTLELPSLFGRRKNRREPTEQPVEQPVEQPAPAAAEPAPPRRKAPRAPRTTALLSAPIAAVLTGLVVGLLGTTLTYVSLRGCEMLKGTESCGATGLGVLVAIVVLMVLGGAVLLRLLRVSESRGTSFLAVGLMCVVVLVTLMENLFSAWMFVAIPLVSAVSYVTAHWVTTQFVETVDERPHVDVR